MGSARAPVHRGARWRWAIVTIKLRRGTEAEWLAANPVLAEGEPGLATDSRILKIGDGETAWDELPQLEPPDTVIYTMAGSDAGLGVTEIELFMDGVSVEDIGIAVPVDMTLSNVTVSWKSDSVPAGSWDVMIERRASGTDSWIPEAIFSLQTS